MGGAQKQYMGRSESEVKMAETKNYKLKKPEGNEIAEINDWNGNMDIIDTRMKEIADAVSASGNASIIKVANTSVPASAWVGNAEITGFAFRAGITIEGCTAEHTPQVFFAAADAMSGNFAPIAKSYDGGVYIYAAEKPTAALTIPTITLLKEAS